MGKEESKWEKKRRCGQKELMWQEALYGSKQWAVWMAAGSAVWRKPTTDPLFFFFSRHPLLSLPLLPSRLTHSWSAWTQTRCKENWDGEGEAEEGKREGLWDRRTERVEIAQLSRWSSRRRRSREVGRWSRQTDRRPAVKTLPRHRQHTGRTGRTGVEEKPPWATRTSSRKAGSRKEVRAPYLFIYFHKWW